MGAKSARRDGHAGYSVAAPNVPAGGFPVQTGVSVSLRFYASNGECFSDWERKDLKRFTALVERLKKLDVEEVRQNDGLCKPHASPPKGSGFERPASLSRDVKFHELKLSGKLRVHGTFHGSVFHLVWLDRNHRAFP